MCDDTEHTEAEIRAYCAQYADTIYVRVPRGFPARHETMALSRVAVPERDQIIRSFVMRGFLPHRSLLTAG
jgi:hypothetical protein